MESYKTASRPREHMTANLGVLAPLFARLREDGGRYLLSVGLTPEERDAQEPPTFGGKASRRWLTDEEYTALCALAEPRPSVEKPARHEGIDFLHRWMRAANPQFGNWSPLEMMEAGKGEKVAAFIKSRAADETSAGWRYVSFDNPPHEHEWTDHAYCVLCGIRYDSLPEYAAADETAASRELDVTRMTFQSGPLYKDEKSDAPECKHDRTAGGVDSTGASWTQCDRCGKTLWDSRTTETPLVAQDPEPRVMGDGWTEAK